MKRFFRLAFFLLSLILGLTLFLAYVQWRIEQPDFVEKLRQHASRELGGQVTFSSYEWKIWKGLQCKDFRLTASRSTGPEPYAATIEEIKIRYNPLALLWGVVEVTRVELRHPHLHLHLNQDGQWNLPLFEELPRIRPTRVAIGPWRLPVSLSLFTVLDGSVLISQHPDQNLLRARQIQMRASLAVSNTGPRAEGRLRADEVILPGQIHLTQFQNDFLYENDRLRIENITARCHGGVLKGQGTGDLGLGGPKYELQITSEGVQVGGVAQDMQWNAPKHLGILESSLLLNGSFLRPAEFRGEGRLTLTDFPVGSLPFWVELADLTRLSELRDLVLPKVTGQFKWNAREAEFYELEAPGSTVELSASGFLATQGALRMSLLLGLAPALAEKMPLEIRNRFQRRQADDLYTLTFNLEGPIGSASSNLREKLTPPPALNP